MPIATQITHAAGIAAAFKLRNQPRVAVVTIGDGGTSKGTSSRGSTAPASGISPMVMIINNNQWAISVPRKLQSSAPTLAQKGIGAGVRSLQVDGNDVVAVFDATRTAVERARSGKGPTPDRGRQLPARGSHHRRRRNPLSGLPPRWKPPGPGEPVKRLRQFMAGQGWWDEAQEQALLAEASREVEHAVAAYEGMMPQAPETLLDYQFAELPKDYRAQRRRIIAKGMQQHGGEAHHE